MVIIHHDSGVRVFGCQFPAMASCGCWTKEDRVSKHGFTCSRCRKVDDPTPIDTRTRTRECSR